MTETSPNMEQNESLLMAFDHFNQELFDGALPRPMLLLSRSKKILGGHFAPNVWSDSEEGEQTIHEISINCNTLAYDSDLTDSLNTLVHEMIHLWQFEFGEPTRNGYHNKEWSNKAESLGLEVIAIDKKGNKTGKKTGHGIDTDRIQGGFFDKAIQTMPEEALFPWVSVDMDDSQSEQNGEDDSKDKEKDKEESNNKKGGKKHKYTCPNCGFNAWAKPEALLMCGSDMFYMVEQKG